MSRNNKNVLGNQRGKIGGIVGRVVDGVQMYSAYTDSVKNPRTRKQTAHRARFSEAVALGKVMTGMLNVGYRNTAAKQKLKSPFNLFIRENMQCFHYDEASHQVAVDYEQVRLSAGAVPKVVFGSATFTEALKVTVPFGSNMDMPGAAEEDSVYVVVYSPELGMGAVAIAARSAETATVELPQVWGGQTVQVWGFVCTAVEASVQVPLYGITLRPGDCSETVYVGSGEVAR